MESFVNWEKSCYASDECGTGAFFGGIVVVAVYIGTEILEQLKKEKYYLEIKDSKEIDDCQINEYAPKIIEILGKNNYEFLDVNAKDFNNKWQNSYKNIKVVLAELHNYVHLRLKKKVKKEEFRVIDAYVGSKNFKSLEMHEWYLREKLKLKQIIPVNEMASQSEKSYLACALASIIAKYYYLKQIETITKKYGIRVPMATRYYGK